MYNITMEKAIVGQLKKISPEIGRGIETKIYTQLAVNPKMGAKALNGPRKGQLSLKCKKDYRIIYRIISATKTVHIIAIGHRRDVYDK